MARQVMPSVVRMKPLKKPVAANTKRMIAIMPKELMPDKFISERTELLDTALRNMLQRMITKNQRGHGLDNRNGAR